MNNKYKMSKRFSKNQVKTDLSIYAEKEWSTEEKDMMFQLIDEAEVVLALISSNGDLEDIKFFQDKHVTNRFGGTEYFTHAITTAQNWIYGNDCKCEYTIYE